MSVLPLISDASLTPCYATLSLRKVASSSRGQTHRDLWAHTSADAESGGGDGLLCEAEVHWWVLHGTTCAGVHFKEKVWTERQVRVSLAVVANVARFYRIRSRSVYGNVTKVTQSFNVEGSA